MFYVCGIENGRMIFLTQKGFRFLLMAQAYADTCAKGLSAFVVHRIDNA